ARRVVTTQDMSVLDGGGGPHGLLAAPGFAHGTPQSAPTNTSSPGAALPSGPSFIAAQLASSPASLSSPTSALIGTVLSPGNVAPSPVIVSGLPSPGSSSQWSMASGLTGSPVGQESSLMVRGLDQDREHGLIPRVDGESTDVLPE